MKIYGQKAKLNLLNLTLKNIHKQYGLHTVLQFDEFHLTTGIYWLKGGNGTGKSTLFRIISGLTTFDGIVKLNNIELKKDPVQFRSKISYSEAEPQYPLFITGRELLNFYQEVRDAKPNEIAELTSLFEMTPFLDQKVGGYSSGMLKKLSLICAFIGSVELIILDEPLITIDSASADKLMHLISEQAKMGKSFLLSSHQEIDKEKLAIATVFEIINTQIVKC